jgi:hypothetical protein
MQSGGESSSIGCDTVNTGQPASARISDVYITLAYLQYAPKADRNGELFDHTSNS